MIYWLIFIAIEIARNYYMIVIMKTKPNYLQSFIFRGIAAILHGAYMFDVIGTFDGVIDMSQFNVLELLGFWMPILTIQVCLFFVLFSPLLNLLRGMKWYYLGKESGWLDRIGLGDYSWVYWFLYGSCCFYLIAYILKLIWS